MSERSNQETPATEANTGEEQMLDCVAIIGLSGRFPGAPNVEAFWRNIAAGKVTVSHFSPSELEARNTAGLEHGSDYVAARGVLEDPACSTPSSLAYRPAMWRAWILNIGSFWRRAGMRSKMRAMTSRPTQGR